MEDSAALVQKVDIVLLAVKPMVVEGVLRPLQGSFSEGQTLISIVAGVTTDQLEKYAGDTVSVVRVMPNSAALVGASATAFCPGQHASAVDTQRTMAIFSAVGQAVEVTEQQMDAVLSLIHI